MRKSIIILLIVLGVNYSFAQVININESEHELIKTFSIYRNAENNIRYDSLRVKLKDQVEGFLNDMNSMNYPMDSLSKYITIVQSADKKLRILSWDELTGGSMHDMAVIVQYKTDSNKIKTQWIDSDISDEPNGITDAIQYEIHDIEINKQKHYLCFGSGTFGSGNHHNTILIFSIKSDSLKHCKECIDEGFAFIVAPRRNEINLSYDKDSKVIKFNEFIYNKEIDLLEPTNEKVRLKLRNGKYCK